MAKPRKCSLRGCREPATMGNSVNRWCSVEHAMQIARTRQAASERKEKKATSAKRKADKAKVEPLSAVLKRTEMACHAYIHARDAGKPCISCGKHCRRMEAGHFKAVGSGGGSPARFHPDGIHLQCHPCNHYNGGGNHHGYRPNLVARIGEDRVLAVERLHHSSIKWDRAALDRLSCWFREAAREIRKTVDAGH